MKSRMTLGFLPRPAWTLTVDSVCAVPNLLQQQTIQCPTAGEAAGSGAEAGEVSI